MESTSGALSAVALLPTRASFEQIRRDLDGIMHLQSYAPSMADLAVAVDNGKINFDRADIVLLADSYPRGTSLQVSETDSVSHLVYFAANWLAPQQNGVTAKPLVVVTTSESATKELISEIYRHLNRSLSEDDSKEAIAKVIVVPADLNALHAKLGSSLERYPSEATPGHMLVLDLDFKELSNGGLAPVITFTSSKGGPGKTTSSILLAFSAAYLAAKKGQRMNVVLVELDLKNATLSSCLTTVNGSNNQKTILNYVTSGVRTETGLFEHLEEVLCADGAGNRLLPEGSFRVLFAPAVGADSDNISPESIEEVLYLLSRSPDVDLIICDTANEVYADECVVAAYKSSDMIVYVARDSASSYGPMPQKLGVILDEHKIARESLKILVNESPRGVTDESLKSDLRKYGAGVAPLGVVPKSEQISLTRDLDPWRAIFADRDLASAYTELCAACGPLLQGKTVSAGVEK